MRNIFVTTTLFSSSSFFPFFFWPPSSSVLREPNCQTKYACYGLRSFFKYASRSQREILSFHSPFPSFIAYMIYFFDTYFGNNNTFMSFAKAYRGYFKFWGYIFWNILLQLPPFYFFEKMYICQYYSYGSVYL